MIKNVKGIEDTFNILKSLNLFIGELQKLSNSSFPSCEKYYLKKISKCYFSNIPSL